MKIKSFIGLCAIAMLSACGGSGGSSEAENKIDPKPYSDSLATFLKDNKVKLDSLMFNMEAFAKDADAGKHKLNYKFSFEDSTLNFKLANETSYIYAVPMQGFNAMYLSDNALLGTPLPTNMSSDIFLPENFWRIKRLIKEGTYERNSYYGEELCKVFHNDRILLQSFLNLKYFIYVKNIKYTGGTISALLSTYDIPYLDGALYVYDVKSKKYCGGGEFTSGGPKDLNYTYKEGDISDQQVQAEKTLNAQTPDTIKFKTIRLLNEFVKINEESID